MSEDPTDRSPGALIVAGLGNAEAFDAFLATLGGLPERVVVIEPMATSGGAHAKGIADLEGVTIVDGIPSETAGETELVRYNVPGLRSSRPPAAGLHELFPGLRARATLRVRKVPLEEAFDILRDPSGAVSLRLDLPGAEQALFEALEASGKLASVHRISLKCSAEPFFEGAWTRAEIVKWLEDRYFTLERVNDVDPDWPDLFFAQDQLARRIGELEAEIAHVNEKASREAAALEAQLAEAQTRLDREGAQHAELKSALQAREAELAEARRESQARSEALAQETAARETLESELARSREEASEAARRVSSAEAERDEVVQALQAREAELAEARRESEARSEALVQETTARETLEAQLTDARGKLEDVQSRLEAERAAAASADERRDKALADLGVALRMQGLLQSDLDDLRARFEEAEKTRLTQEELLGNLTPRLQDAAQQLRQMKLLPESDAAAAVSTATSGKKARSFGA